jgi:hypothetical protein
VTVVVGVFAAAAVPAQAPPAPNAGLRTGPATIAPHWSKYKYPEAVAEGDSYYIVERGDTLWDISRRFLANPYLWPQVWDKNRYIADAHWIYPGDPLVLPAVALVAPSAGQPGGETGAGAGGAGAGEAGAGGAGAAESTLYPAIEEVALTCAHYIAPEPEDLSLHVIGSEQGETKISLSERDVIYLSQGSGAGLKAGDVYALRRPTYEIKHPSTGRTLGTKVETSGLARIILVEESTASAVIELSCIDAHAGDFLTPAERAAVPMLARQVPPDRLTPASGKSQGYVVDIAHDSMIAGEGQLVSVDLGSADGLAPGNRMTVFKVLYPSVPTSRNVVGELAVVAVRERTATARVLYSSDAIMNGDQVEVR